MSKNFGKYFGPSTRDLSFRLRCPSFLLSKFASQLHCKTDNFLNRLLMTASGVLYIIVVNVLSIFLDYILSQWSKTSDFQVGISMDPRCGEYKRHKG